MITKKLSGVVVKDIEGNVIVDMTRKSLMVADMYLLELEYEDEDIVIKPEQIWRHNTTGNNIEIDTIDNKSSAIYSNEYWNYKPEDGSISIAEDVVLEEYTLVTIDNVRAGEYIKNDYNTFRVASNTGTDIMVEYSAGTVTVDKGLFKPCLDPEVK